VDSALPSERTQEDSKNPEPPPSHLGLHLGGSFLVAALVAAVQGYLQGRGFYPSLSVAGYLGWAVITLTVAWGSAALIRAGRHEAFSFGFVIGTVVCLFLLTGFSWRMGFNQELSQRLDVQQVNEWANFVATQTPDITDAPVQLALEVLPGSVSELWRRPPTRVEVLKLFLGQETAVIDIRWQSGFFAHGLLIGPDQDVQRYNELGSTEIEPGIHFYRWLE
jgi:hypothetical protein